jgi:hypothetical protein
LRASDFTMLSGEAFGVLCCKRDGAVYFGDELAAQNLSPFAVPERRSIELGARRPSKDNL